MLAHAFFFYFFSIIAIFSSLMVITSRNTVNSVFFLILDFISVGCLFIMVGAEFLGMIILIVYVGAVAVLFLSLYFHPPTTTNNSKRIKTLTINPVGMWVDFFPINQDCFCSATLSIMTTNKNKTATAPT